MYAFAFFTTFAVKGFWQPVDRFDQGKLTTAMPRYRIVYWKEIPSMVVVQDDGRELKAQLPPRFQAAIDAYAMAAGLTGTEEYLAGWKRGPWQERDGTPEDVSRDVVAELEVQFKKIEFPKKDNQQ